MTAKPLRSLVTVKTSSYILSTAHYVRKVITKVMYKINFNCHYQFFLKSSGKLWQFLERKCFKLSLVLKLRFNKNSKKKNKWSWTLKQKGVFLVSLKVHFFYKWEFFLTFLLISVRSVFLFVQIRHVMKKRTQYPITVSFIIKSTKNVQLPINARSTASWHGGRQLSFHQVHRPAIWQVY